MKELFQHVENLLTGHDCVVVPGLGGFIIQETSCKTDPDKHLFYPGTKEIGFNIRLTFNDGILIQSFQESHQISFEAASSLIKEKVTLIRERLAQGKFVDVGTLGILHLNKQGQLLFKPQSPTPFNPENFGLAPFTFPALEQRSHSRRSREKHLSTIRTSGALKKDKPVKVKREKRVKVKREKHRRNNEYIQIRFKRSLFNDLLLGVTACLLLVLLIAKPITGNNINGQEAFLMNQYVHYLTDSLSYFSSGHQTVASSADTVQPVTATTTTGDIDSLFGLIDSNTTPKDLHEQIESGAKQSNQSSPQPKPGTPGKTTAQTNKTAAQTSTPPLSQAAPQPSAQPVSQTAYHIIISSFPNRLLAEKWLKKHTGDIYAYAHIIEGDGRARVTITQFQQKAEAESFLNHFRVEYPEHQDAWLLRSKN